jgi:hypothetical protein
MSHIFAGHTGYRPEEIFWDTFLSHYAAKTLYTLSRPGEGRGEGETRHFLIAFNTSS